MVGLGLLLLLLIKKLLPTILLVIVVCYVVNKFNNMGELDRTKKSAQTLWYLTGTMYFLRKIIKFRL